MKVAIVGGGLAGIAAAHTLLADVRVTEVHLLEASGRYGGRACTDSQSIPGFAFDMGAQYIQDPSINPLTAIAKRLGFLTIPEDADYQLRVEAESGWTDEPVNTPSVQAEVDAIQDSFDSASQRPNVIVAPKPAAKTDVALFGHATSTYGPFTESAETWQYIAADRAREAAGDGEANLFVKEGVGTLVAAYGQELPQVGGSRYRPRFDTQVSAVEQSSSAVTLTDENGTKLIVDACIVTVPVSVLAAGQIKFTPPLPEPCKAALKVLRLGSYKKLALKLRSDPASIKPGTNYYLIQDDLQGVWQYYRLPFQANVLLAHAAGDFAERLDSMRDADVIQLFKTRIQTACDDVYFSNGQAVTNWTRAPFAQGAYSYSAFNGGGPDDPATLAARPALAQETGRVLIAGEATNEPNYGTLQAAFFEGERAAKALLKLSI
jgi:monoamine oxidase